MKLFEYTFGTLVSVGRNEEEARLNLYQDTMRLIINEDKNGAVYSFVMKHINKRQTYVEEYNKSELERISND